MDTGKRQRSRDATRGGLGSERDSFHDRQIWVTKVSVPINIIIIIIKLLLCVHYTHWALASTVLESENLFCYIYVPVLSLEPVPDMC